MASFGNGPNGREPALVAPALRLQTLSPLAGSLALVGDGGAVTARLDVAIAVYKDARGGGAREALRPSEVECATSRGGGRARMAAPSYTRSGKTQA